MSNKTHIKNLHMSFDSFPSDWKCRPLSAVATIFSSNVDKKIYISEEEVLLCNYMDVFYNDYIVENFEFMKATASVDEIKKFQLKKNDVVLTKDSETREDISKSSFVEEEINRLLCGYHLTVIRPNQETIDGEYLSKIFSSNYLHRYFVTKANGVTRFGLTLATIKNAPILIPPISEQKKIAKIIRLWHRAIKLVEKQIKAKQKLKKGLMQQLLSGKMRFPGFIKSQNKKHVMIGKIPEDWQFVPISIVASQANSKNEKGEDIPVLSCTKYDGLVESLKYFGKRIFSKDISGYKIVGRGHFAYATNHIEEGSIGYQNLFDKGLVSPMYTVFKAKEKINEGFLYKLLKTETYRRVFKINTNATVNRRGSLRWSGFSKIRIPLPSLDEQKAINSFIDNCENEIELLKNKKLLYEEQKSGLMQKLLTGEIRVKV